MDEIPEDSEERMDDEADNREDEHGCSCEEYPGQHCGSCY